MCHSKRWFPFSKFGFCAGTKRFEEALNTIKFLDWLKQFGLAQKMLGPIGQGIKFSERHVKVNKNINVTLVKISTHCAKLEASLAQCYH